MSVFLLTLTVSFEVGGIGHNRVAVHGRPLHVLLPRLLHLDGALM